ncbi:GDSL esterase/lipase At4g16230 isoform X1 [Setaria italica]|uniref:GDSL esterase/lipase At4g16230 isoform X1 n=1 Tax=Setaria italica TaxID=4555 RepID=UPI000BE53A85|nr:GDSL esterase/lipase At4g16230 isoform X1 [Setaria italica]
MCPPHERRPRVASHFVLLACLVLLAPTRVAGAGMPATFIFGDSLVDAGNNNYIVSLSKANYPPNGIDFLGHQPTGRYTNGRTIVDILGQEMGLGGFVPPYMSPETTGDALLRGVNYASGGGGILNQTGSIFGGRLNLDAQIDNYANSRHDLIARHGEVAAVSLLRGALFSVTMGSNDFINNYLTPILSVPERASTPPAAFIGAMIAKYRQQLARLYLLDARKVVVANVGPIGCIPYQRETNPSAAAACAEFPNQLARSFNRRLRALVDELGAALPGSRFVYADVYHIVSDIIANYRSHGVVKESFGGWEKCCEIIVILSISLLSFVQGSRWRTRRAATWAGGSAGWCRAGRRRGTARTGPSTCSGTPTTPATPPTRSSPAGSSTAAHRTSRRSTCAS